MQDYVDTSTAGLATQDDLTALEGQVATIETTIGTSQGCTCLDTENLLKYDDGTDISDVNWLSSYLEFSWYGGEIYKMHAILYSAITSDAFSRYIEIDHRNSRCQFRKGHHETTWTQTSYFISPQGCDAKGVAKDILKPFFDANSDDRFLCYDCNNLSGSCGVPIDCDSLLQ